VTSRCEQGGDPLCEARAFAGFVERVKAAAVENEVEGVGTDLLGEKVGHLEPARRRARTWRSRPRALDGERRNVNAENVEPMLGE
jgi:hypothetical protein